jgi:hypothetical protein
VLEGSFFATVISLRSLSNGLVELDYEQAQ